MSLGAWLIAYFAGLALVVGVLLFGEASALRGTPIAWLHHALTRGWLDAVEWAAYLACGERGAVFLNACAAACCERRNPALQALYVAIVAGRYAACCRSVFVLVPRIHIVIGTAATAAALASFAVVCAADPGRVTAHNAAALLAAYGSSGSSACGTCAAGGGSATARRVARSHHCRICGVCVARYDHHCFWLNTCVGLLNTRHFLAFLVINLALAGYTAWLAAAAVWGDLARRGTLDMWVLDRKLGRPVPLTRRPGRLVEIVCVYYGRAAALGVFAALAGALLAAFLAQQAYNVAVGVTTYEQLKGRRPRRRQRRRQPDDSFARRAQSNFSEVLRPHAFLAAAVTARARLRRPRQAAGAGAAAASGGQQAAAAAASAEGDGRPRATRRRRDPAEG